MSAEPPAAACQHTQHSPLPTRTGLGICIVHFHAEPLLQRCLDQLRASRFRDFTVRIVDCGSRSGLQDLCAGHDRLSLLEPGRNLGFAAACNLGFADMPAEVRFLLCLNPDVMLEPNTLSVVLQALQSDPTLAAASCRLELPSGKIDPACRRSDPSPWSALSHLSGLAAMFPGNPRLGHYLMADVPADRAHDIGSGTGAFLMMRRDAFEAVGGFDEGYFLYGEDLDLCRRLRASGQRIRYLPEARALHIKGSGRARGASAVLHFHRAMWIYYRRWGRRRTNPLVLTALALALAGFGTLDLLRQWLRGIRSRQA